MDDDPDSKPKAIESTLLREWNLLWNSLKNNPELVDELKSVDLKDQRFVEPWMTRLHDLSSTAALDFIDLKSTDATYIKSVGQLLSKRRNQLNLELEETSRLLDSLDSESVLGEDLFDRGAKLNEELQRVDAQIRRLQRLESVS